MTRQKIFLILEAMIVMIPLLWTWISVVYLVALFPSPFSFILIIPGLMGLIGFGMLLQSVLNQTKLKMPYFSFFLIGAGCVLCLGFAFGDGSYLNPFNIALLMPVIVSMHLSWLYYQNVNHRVHLTTHSPRAPAHSK